jgi:hypothetical protein
MVIDLTVHSQNIAVMPIDQRLRAVFHVYDAKTLVRNNDMLVAVNAAPVGATVPDILGLCQDLVTQVRVIAVDQINLEDCDNSAHSGKLQYPRIHGSDGSSHLWNQITPSERLNEVSMISEGKLAARLLVSRDPSCNSRLLKTSFLIVARQLDAQTVPLIEAILSGLHKMH